MNKFIFVIVSLVLSSVTFANSTVKNMDLQALADLESEFKVFEKISMAQYLRLKETKDARLVNAQTMVHQYIDSSVLQVVPAPDKATQDEINAEYERREQHFHNPVMFQTGLEIIAHELVKPADEMKCPLVFKTLRFLALGVDGLGKTTPGLDYRRNQLMLLHLYAAYVSNSEENALPCEDELNSYIRANPSLKNTYRPGCELQPWDITCLVTNGRYGDVESLIAAVKLARAFGSRDIYSFNGGGGSFRYGIFNTKSGFQGRYRAETYFDSPEQKNRRWAKAELVYSNPHPKNWLFNSSLRLAGFDYQDSAVAPAHEISKAYSDSVFIEYGNLAKSFLK
ncbi:hypothetical protein [Bdellovibrio sp. HCB2-146]|uniref:hypothetical protein n=1 Tax=Bdellovibrio sp. HCB2-146 TaxID=3394362 RepID=UPI0039BD54A6